MNAVIGIDLGTQGTKTALYREDGERLAEAFQCSEPHKPDPGTVEEDPEVQLGSVCTTIRECVEQSGIDDSDIVGLAIDGQMAGVIGVGEDGRNVTPYDSWLDTRCGPYITQMQERAGDEIVEKTGNVPSFNHGPKKLWWKHERPDVYANIVAFVQPGGYVAMRLCGLKGTEAFVDTTYLHFSGFADNRERCWDEALCNAFDFDRTKLPKIVEPSRVIGEVVPAMAEACGLKSGTPVVAGCGDTAASFLSCGATQPGICVDVAGTASVFAATTEVFIADTKSRMLGCGHSATPGLWHPYAYINGGGQNLEWFREIQGGGLTLVDLNGLAAKVKQRDDLPLFIPHLGGRVSPGWPNIRGSWAGLTWDHGPAELYRAMLEGVALEYGLYKDALLNLIPNFKLAELRITGGGEKSTSWNQLKADVLQTSIVQIDCGSGAPMGSALLAGYGVGLFDDLNVAAEKWIATGRRFDFDSTLAEHYAKRKRGYSNLLEALNEWSEKE
jgi:xylulokinase